MGRTPCCEKIGLNRGKWTAEEDEKLVNYINANGEGSWRSLPKNAGLLRCGKSCRLRWINYLRTDVKRGNFTEQEDQMIVKLHNTLGNRWSVIASQIPGRTDNEIKNYWNSHLSRKTYRYRFIGEATLSTAEMINIAKKKRSIAAPPHKDTIKPNTSAEQEQEQELPSSSDQPPPAVPVDLLLCLEPSRTNEEKNKGMGMGGWPHDASLMLSPSEVDDEISMHLNYFLDTTHQSHNKTHRLIMAKHHSSPPAYMSDHEETDCADAHWTSTLDCVELYDCLSPIVYFTDDLLHSDHNPAGNHLNLWNQEDHDIIWS